MLCWVYSGGYGGSSYLSEVLRYNPDTDQWEKIADLDKTRRSHGASAVKWNVIAPFCIPPGAECWSQSSGEIGQCGTTGTECLPWLPDGGTWDGASAKYCLHSHTEGQSCDYGQKTHLCDPGLRCDDGLCQGTVTLPDNC